MAEREGFSRREVARWLAIGGAMAAVGCGVGAGGSPGAGSGGGDSGAGEGGSGGEGVSSWAAGGTAAMTGKGSYPDPFVAAGASCALLCETTEGPCTADTAEREDVSEGMSGLPVRLLLRVVDGDCQPVVGARVLIWHTQRTGVYSGVTPSGSFCYGDDPEAEQHLYFRGNQLTDGEGVAAFDTCFPGWYSGRMPHIHVQVLLGEDLYLTTQVVFEDALCAEVYSTHEEYVEFGQADTTAATDTVLGGVDDVSPYTLETERMDDGAMLAWKTIAVRSSLSEATCATEGGGGGGGAPPPGARGRRGPPPGPPGGRRRGR
jgi:protocatechuate 3,4-dioxygenase beta subunit